MEQSNENLNNISNTTDSNSVINVSTVGNAKQDPKIEISNKGSFEKKSVDFVNPDKKGFDLDKIKFVFVPIFLFVIGLLVIVLVTYPKVKEYYANLTIVKQKEEEIGKLSDKLKMLQQFSSVENALDENALVLTKSIPTEQTVPQFMTLIQNISKTSGVNLKALSYSGTSPTSEQSTLTTSGLSKIELVYIQGSATGDYNAIKTFVRNLESSLRIMNIDNVRVTTDSSQTKDQSVVSLTFAITAYSAVVEAQAVAEQPINFNLTDGNFNKVLDFLKGQSDYNVDVSNIGIGKPDPFSN